MYKLNRETTVYLKNIFNPIDYNKMYKPKKLPEQDEFRKNIGIKRMVISPFDHWMTDDEFKNTLVTSYTDVENHPERYQIYKELEEKYDQFFLLLYEKYRMYIHNGQKGLSYRKTLLKKYTKFQHEKFLGFESLKEFLIVTKESVREWHLLLVMKNFLI